MTKVPILAVLPPLIFAGIAGLFLGGMFRDDPDALPSSQEGLPAPLIEDLTVGSLPGFSSADLGVDGPVVVNFWASWCAPCRLEHPFVMEIAQFVPVYGVNRDTSDDQAEAFLAELGDPYSGVVADPRNRQSIEWGVYALPETFVVGADGTVLVHVRGPINAPLFENRIKPALGLVPSAE